MPLDAVVAEGCWVLVAAAVRWALAVVAVSATRTSVAASVEGRSMVGLRLGWPQSGAGRRPVLRLCRECDEWCRVRVALPKRPSVSRLPHAETRRARSTRSRCLADR